VPAKRSHCIGGGWSACLSIGKDICLAFRHSRQTQALVKVSALRQIHRIVVHCFAAELVDREVGCETPGDDADLGGLREQPGERQGAGEHELRERPIGVDGDRLAQAPDPTDDIRAEKMAGLRRSRSSCRRSRSSRWAAAGFMAPRLDYLAFTQVFLNEGRAAGGLVLKPETVQLMAENAIGAINVKRLKTVAPAYSNDAEFVPGMVKKWGLGFMISPAEVPGGRRPWSLAWAGLGNTYFWINPCGERDRRHPDATDPVRRCQGAEAARRLREGSVRDGFVNSLDPCRPSQA
jgi:hypothetical protein